MTAVAAAFLATPGSEAWLERELAKAGPLTQEQQSELRRVLLPPTPIARPA